MHNLLNKINSVLKNKTFLTFSKLFLFAVYGQIKGKDLLEYWVFGDCGTELGKTHGAHAKSVQKVNQ